jgi:transcriptional regulator with XRE-family HTH domain
MTVQDLNTIFGRNIRNQRNLCGFSQEQLAEKMDLSINTICEIENGKKFVRAETLVGFAALFNTEVYELFKPETIFPDNATGILVKYSEDVKDAVEKIRSVYLAKIKR